MMNREKRNGMRIAVYCGSRCGDDPIFAEAARELGAWIGRQGHTLVYGAGFVGMMGELSKAVQENGGGIIGVIPQFMVDEGWQKPDLILTEDEMAGTAAADAGVGVLFITESMSERKAMMLDLADVYIALPGGPGTLEEITEAISLSCVHQHEKECILLNLDGYYDSLLMVYEDLIARDFTDRELLQHVHFAETVEEVERLIR